MMQSRSQALQEAYDWCEDITRRRARNFYYGLKLSPEPQRSALYGVYAWMRHADDIVDDAPDGPDAARTELAAFRERTMEAIDAARTPAEPLWCVIRDVTRRFSLDRSLLHDMLDGQLADLDWQPYETMDELERYCYQVAGTVALACVEIWGYEDVSTRQLAIDRGIAFQLTNILRDFREDFDDERVYLPGAAFREHSLTARELRDWSHPDACRRFIQAHVDRAAALYAKSASLEGRINPSCRPTLWAMTRIYRNILRKIEQHPAQIVSARRVRLNGLHKGVIAIRARWQQRLAREVVS